MTEIKDETVQRMVGLPDTFEEMTAGADGWCDWVHPLNPYFMKCCDCGLVHDQEYQIVPSDGNAAFNPGESDAGVIIFRARRAIDQSQSIDAAIAQFKATLPGWWYTIGDCSVSCDASCGPDVSGPDATLLRSHPDVFDGGFHADLPQPSTVVSALLDVMDQALEARHYAWGERA
jgi:hypothetical protein